MHAFDVLADPVRRRLLELLAEGERSSGDMTNIIQAEFGVTQSAVSQHLKVLRDNAFATVRIDGSRRIYAVNAEPMQDIDVWLDRFRAFWAPKLEALATEIARGKRQRRLADTQKTAEPDSAKAADAAKVKSGTARRAR